MNSLLYLQKCYKKPTLRILNSVCSRSFQVVSKDSIFQKPYFPTSSQVRTFWETFPYVRPFYYKKDGLESNKYKIIYHSKIFYYAFYGQLFGQLAVLGQTVGASIYAYRSYVAQEVVKVFSDPAAFPFVVNYDLLTILAITALNIQNCALIIAAQRALLRVYYNEDADQFVFVSLGINPFKSKLTICKPGELVPLKESIFNFLLGNHNVDGENFFVRYDQFKSMYYYNRLVGDNYNKIDQI